MVINGISVSVHSYVSLDPPSLLSTAPISYIRIHAFQSNPRGGWIDLNGDSFDTKDW